MRNILWDVQLSFDSEEEMDDSEEILVWLLGIGTRLSMKWLWKHPETPMLYESGVRYALPDQMATCRVDPSQLRRVATVLHEIGANDETVAFVLRYLKGIEIFRDLPTLFARRFGDCDNLTVARCAECWRAGLPASPKILGRANARGGMTYHAVVELPPGFAVDGDRLEDPSLILGMGGARRAADATREREKNLVRHRWLTRACPDASIGGSFAHSYGFVPRGGFR